ncbi:MAG: 3TM-type holin, partial [Mariprofundales bacterium]
FAVCTVAGRQRRNCRSNYGSGNRWSGAVVDLSTIGRTVAQFAPMLGKLLPIPGAGIAGDLIASAFGVDNTPDAIHGAIASDPAAATKLAQIEADNRALIQQQLLTAETARIQAVNATMQAEATSEHWMQWAWRPFNGFLFGVAVVCIYFVLPIANMQTPDINPMVWTMWGGILGVTAWHRGASKPAGAIR